MNTLSPAARAALAKIVALRKYPVPATEKAVQIVLGRLGLQDLIEVTSIIDVQPTENVGSR